MEIGLWRTGIYSLPVRFLQPRLDPGIVHLVSRRVEIKLLAGAPQVTPSNLVLDSSLEGFVASGGRQAFDGGRKSLLPDRNGNVFANPRRKHADHFQRANDDREGAGCRNQSECRLSSRFLHKTRTHRDCHRSRLHSGLFGSNATAAALHLINQVPQLAPNPLDVRSSRQKRGFADGGNGSPTV